MISDRARRETASDTAVKPLLTRLTVKLNCFTLNPDFIFATETDAVETLGEYFLSYKPRTDTPILVARGPFVIKCDMLHSSSDVRVKDWDDVVERGKVSDVHKFLTTWTTLSPKLFDVARRNPGVPMPFTIKITEYEDYLRELHYAEHGEYPAEDYPLLSSYARDTIYINEKNEYDKAIRKNKIEAERQKKIAEREQRKQENNK